MGIDKLIQEQRPEGPGLLHHEVSPEQEAEADSGDRSENEEDGRPLEWFELARIAFVALAAAAVWFRIWEPFPRVSLIGVAATLIGGYPIVKEAWENMVERKMTMELSMTIALLSALAIGEFFTALVITGFVLAAEVLEGLTVGRGRRAIQDSLDFLPRTVSIRRDSQVTEVRAAEVRLGDVVIVKPGGHIPVDGIVIDGQSFVEQAAITGEPMPVEKTPGASVYAGTMNQSGALEIDARKLGKDTSFGRIVEAVERAERSRAPIQKTADRLAGYLVYFALGAAVLTLLLTHNIRSTISVVIVAGACGIAAGTPLAVLGAIGRAARQGSIIKGGRYLEELASVDTVVVDKTGTLTFGTPKIHEVISSNGFSIREIVATASMAESRSEHPLAKAIIGRARESGIPIAEPEQFSYTPGRGVRVTYQGEEILVGSLSLLVDHGMTKGLPANHGTDAMSEVYVARSGQVLGAIRVSDVLRPEAREAVTAMRQNGTQNCPFEWGYAIRHFLRGSRSRRGRVRGRPPARRESRMDPETAREKSQSRHGGRWDQ